MSTSSDDGEPDVKCAMCYRELRTFEARIPFTAAEDIVFVNCAWCERMIYARRESRVIESARWRATA